MTPASEATPGKPRRHPRRVGDVQRTYVAARAIVDGTLLCLRPPGAPASPVPGPEDTYCAVVQVCPINFLLRSEGEQAERMAGFGAWLNALRFPIQILVQVRRLDLGPYVSRLQIAVRTQVEAMEERRAGAYAQERWVSIATDHVDFLETLARQQLLLERHFYVILAYRGETEGRLVGKGILQTISRRRFRILRRPTALGGRPEPGPHAAPTRQRQVYAQQQLDLRVGELTRQFERMGLEVRRLSDHELATVYYRALTPERATLHPLAAEVIAGLGRPIAAATAPTDLTVAAPEGDAYHGVESPGPARQRDFAGLADILAPASVELAPDHLCLEGEYSRILAVTGYPRRVYPGWLARIIDEDMPLDVALHIHPRDSRAALATLRRHLAQYEASAALDHRMGRLPDPERRVALEDVTRLQERIERGVTHVFDFGLYIRLYATRQGGLAQLEQRTEQVYGAFDHLGVVARSSLWEQDLGLAAVLPEGRDALHRTRFFDTETIATAWPFSTSSISMPHGILFGIVPHSGSFVILDPFSPSFENANQVVFGVSGSGKSYATKLRVVRSLLAGIAAVIVDPENEYQQLGVELGGQCIRLAPGSNQHINPFDLPASTTHTGGEEDALADKIQSLHAFFDLLLAERVSGQYATLGRGEKALLDRVIAHCYERAGITGDPRTHTRPAPLLRDVYDLLVSDPAYRGEDTTGLASRLHRYVDGALARLFAAPTDVELDNPLVVFNIADLDEELRPLGLYLVSDCIWTHVRREHHSPRPRLLVVDEAWSLLQFPEGGRFLAGLVRRARKRYLGVVTISQDINDFLGSEWGQTILKNSAAKLLMKQDASSIDVISETFKLSSGERRRLLTSEKGEGLIFALGTRVALRVEASPDEHALATTDPGESPTLPGGLDEHRGAATVDEPGGTVETPGDEKAYQAQPWVPAVPGAFAAMQAGNSPSGEPADTLLHLPTRYWRRAAAHGAGDEPRAGREREPS